MPSLEELLATLTTLGIKKPFFSVVDSGLSSNIVNDNPDDNTQLGKVLEVVRTAASKLIQADIKSNAILIDRIKGKREDDTLQEGERRREERGPL